MGEAIMVTAMNGGMSSGDLVVVEPDRERAAELRSSLAARCGAAAATSVQRGGR
jgi:hypothetical protein